MSNHMKRYLQIYFRLLLAAHCCGWANFSIANDTTARVETGGLVFLKSKYLRMDEEVLEISQKKIRVTYKFFNESNADILTTVAFPMPLFRWNPGESASDENIKPLVNFKTWVDQMLVPTNNQTRAYLNGQDVTSKLKSIGFDEADIVGSLGCSLVQINVGCIRKDILRKFPAIARKSGEPLYSVQQTAFWQQNFPAGHSITVIHEYKPFMGSQSVSLDNPDLPPTAIGLSDGRPESRRLACTDEGAEKAVAARLKRLDQTGVYLNDVSYILGTGRNWKGPIRSFTLKITKEKPDQIISLCFPGKPTRVDDKTLEFRQTNYVPQDTLVVYFYSFY